MIIKKMRACFGVLQNQTLELEEGLNIIEAPNEGGKSTWSAFLRAMFYGINTKERDKQGYIAEKNRYQPWSGGAMEGVLELEWGGKEITLRRSAKGNAPFAKCEAVYTATGEPVPGLTGENCGEMLLGVPREVFERSAFVGQGATAIDGAPALEARIAALCSSGEEDVSYSQVERRLRDWQNRRRHNKTGLIPKLEGDLTAVEDTLARQGKAHRLGEEARRELGRLEVERTLLEQELVVHGSVARAEHQRKYDGARSALEGAQAEVDTLRRELTRDGTPPDRATLRTAQEDLNYINAVNVNIKQVENQAAEAKRALEEARTAAADPLFPALSPDEAWKKAGEDAETAGRTAPSGVGALCGGLFLAAALVALLVGLLGPWPGREIAFLPAAVFAVAGAVLLARVALLRRGVVGARAAVLARYGVACPEEILERAGRYREKCALAAEAEKKYAATTETLGQLTDQRDSLRGQLLALTHTFAPSVTDVFGVSAAISRALGLEEKLATALVRLEGTQHLFDSLTPPGENGVPIPDVMPRFAPAETAAHLKAAEGEVKRLQNGLAMADGEWKALGDPVLLQTHREELGEALERRREEYDALTLALDGLEEAHSALQERFSPALNRRAGALMGTLTGGKYAIVTLDRQFEATAEENGALLPRRALALSRGTADQLYLAVRLAVCELALPETDRSPLVLDDALTNFDDGRMALAMECLADLAQERQILLFTCHSRESRWVGRTGRGHSLPLHS